MMRSLVAAAVVIAFVAFLWLFVRMPVDDVAQSDDASSASEVKREAGSAPVPRRRLAAVDVDETANDPVPWEILVLGAHDAPLAGVTVKPVIDERTDRPRTTDAGGLARLQRFPGQTFVVVDLGGTAPAQRVRLSEPRTVVRIPDALPLVVHLVDGETGAAIFGGSVKVDGRDVPPAPDGDGFRLGATSIRRGATADLDVEVTAPKGHVGFHGPISALVGTFTDAAELTVVLWPELELTAEVRDVNGAAAADVIIGSVRVGGQHRPFYGRWTDAGGRAAVREVPFVRNAKVSIGVSRAGRAGIGHASLGSIPGAPCVVPIALVESPSGGVAPTSVVATFTSRGWRIEGSFDPPQGGATVVVTVTRIDGSAAADVPVGFCGVLTPICGRTDGDGRVTFTHVPVGESSVAVYGEGITAADRKVVMVAGATTTISIRSTPGLTSTVTVLDETNRPLPCAAVSIAGDSHVQDEAGVQHLILRADAYGRCRLHGLSAGKATAHVQWDARSADLEFTAGEDATVVLAAER